MKTKLILFFSWMALNMFAYLLLSLYEWNMRLNEWPHEIRLILCIALAIITKLHWLFWFPASTFDKN